uniref:Uncharacterized protein n=1 Tax=Caulobacter phage BL57 TaxID=3348355 RepID=A0AB74UG07_9VIRU
MASSVNLTMWSNENFVRDFVLRNGKSTAYTSFNLTNAVLRCDIRDLKTGEVLMSLSTQSPLPDGSGLIVLDATTGRFGFRLAPFWDKFPKADYEKRLLGYDLVMERDGVLKRLFGGRVFLRWGVSTAG